MMRYDQRTWRIMLPLNQNVKVITAHLEREICTYIRTPDKILVLTGTTFGNAVGVNYAETQVIKEYVGFYMYLCIAIVS